MVCLRSIRSLLMMVMIRSFWFGRVMLRSRFLGRLRILWLLIRLISILSVVR